jgi:hypothetical protein
MSTQVSVVVYFKKRIFRGLWVEQTNFNKREEDKLMDTPESTVDDSIDRILSCPSSLTKKYPSHLLQSKKIHEQTNAERPFASLTQIKSGESLINPNMVQLFYW